MHICPQEILMIMGSLQTVKPALWVLKQWCELCVNGTHKSCEDHAKDNKAQLSENYSFE